MKRLFFYGILILIPLLALEFLSALAIHISPALLGWQVPTTEDIFQDQTRQLETLLLAGEDSRVKIDSILGWTYRPGYESDIHHINTQSLRSFRTYGPSADSIFRVTAFGDSFVYGEEVTTDQSWPYLLEAGREDLEVLNFGVGGYGTDQAFLRFLCEGRSFEPDLVIIGFAPVDIRRNVNVYRRFLSEREVPLFKPRFELGRDGSLKLIPSPLRKTEDYENLLGAPGSVVEFGEHDWWYDPLIYENPFYDHIRTIRFLSYFGTRLWDRYLDPDRVLRRDYSFNPESSAFHLQVALFSAFADSASKIGAAPIITLFPDHESILRARRGEPTRYGPLKDLMVSEGYMVFDLVEAFVEAQRPSGGLSDWFAPGGHYSEAGNRLVSEWLDDRIAGLSGSEGS